MSGVLHPAPDGLPGWAQKRTPSSARACPACASLAPRMRVNTREWIQSSVASFLGRRLSRIPIVSFATDLAGFCAGIVVERAVKHICAGSSHAKREANRVAHWRRAIATR